MAESQILMGISVQFSFSCLRVNLSIGDHKKLKALTYLFADFLQCLDRIFDDFVDV